MDTFTWDLRLAILALVSLLGLLVLLGLALGARRDRRKRESLTIDREFEALLHRSDRRAS